jgi:universal stress protein A
MIKTILLATDFTPGADQAQSFAVELAAQVGATLHLLHVIEPIGKPAEDPDIEEFHSQLNEKALTKLGERIAQISQSHNGLRLESSVVLGHRSPVIAEKAHRLQADCIVMGMRSDHGASAVGSGVVQRADVPIILVPLKILEA